jgi:hypothetical protein
MSLITEVPVVPGREFLQIKRLTDVDAVNEIASWNKYDKFVWIKNHDVDPALFENFDFSFVPTKLEADRIHLFVYEDTPHWLAKLVPLTWKESNAYVLHVVNQSRTVVFRNKFLNHIPQEVADYLPPPYDLKYTHVWRFDASTTDGKSIDAIHINYCDNPQGIKVVDATVTNKYAVEWNTELPDRTYVGLESALSSVHYSAGKYTTVFYLDDENNTTKYNVWIVKLVPPESTGLKVGGRFKPTVDLAADCKLEYNPLIVEQEYPAVPTNFVPAADKVKYQHVWYIEDALIRYGTNTWGKTSERTWLAKYGPENPIGTVEVAILPAQVLVTNPDIPDCELKGFNFDALADSAGYTKTWYLDPSLTNGEQGIWAVKYGTGASSVNMGMLKPEFSATLEYNKDYALWDWDEVKETFKPTYSEMWYEHVWYKAKTLKVWGVKAKFTSKTKGVIHHGYIEPKVPAWPVGKLDAQEQAKSLYWKTAAGFKFDEHWNPRFMPSIGNEKKVHVFGLRDPRGEFIDYGGCYLLPNRDITDQEILKAVKVSSSGAQEDDFDVVFLSNNEPYADAHYAELLKIVPNAKRVNGVKGIAAAHIRAAEVAETNMVFIVDADCRVLDSRVFLHHPLWADRNNVHVWKSRNPVNGLEYGYGAIKLFNRHQLLGATTWTVDFSTTFNNKFKVINKLVCETAFNYNEETTWRSAFRECAKLAAKIIPNQIDTDTIKRLEVWTTQGADKPYGEWAIKGAQAGRDWALTNPEQLHLLNDYDWLADKFKEQLC